MQLNISGIARKAIPEMFFVGACSGDGSGVADLRFEAGEGGAVGYEVVFSLLLSGGTVTAMCLTIPMPHAARASLSVTSKDRFIGMKQI